MLCGPQCSEQQSRFQCGICGSRTELFELRGHAERLCLSCGADLAISEQLTIEIDAAALAGRETKNLVAEFTQLSQRILERAQSF
jgi:hypothetical protein